MEETKTVTPKELASKLGIKPKRVRMILRAQYSREAKNKSWQLTPEEAKKVVREYRAKVKEKEQKRQAKIQKELEAN